MVSDSPYLASQSATRRFSRRHVTKNPFCQLNFEEGVQAQNRVNERDRDISTVNPYYPANVGDKRSMINSDLPALFRNQVQVLGGQLSYSGRHMGLPVERIGRLDMG